jgi:hypothetical protein
VEDAELVFQLEETEEALPATEMGNGEAPPMLETVLS